MADHSTVKGCHAVGNLSHLPEPLIEVIRRALRGETFVPVGERLQVVRSLPHGHVQAVRMAMQRLGFESLIASRESPERERACAMVAARVLSPHTKLATTRCWGTTTLAEEYGVQEAAQERADPLASGGRDATTGAL